MSGLIYAFWLFLPAGLANMAPVLANKVPLLNQFNTPLDFEKSWQGKRIFGENKTWRGLITGTVLASMGGLVLYQLVALPYQLSTFVVGSALMGFGALSGDAIESFFKRRTRVQPGESWFPFDQLDYIAGGLLLSYPLLKQPVVTLGLTVIIYFGLHLLFSFAGYKIGLKSKPI